MDGRRLQLWLCGGLLIGGPLGCTRSQTLPGGLQLPPPAPSGQKGLFSPFKNGSLDNPPSAAAPNVPVDVSGLVKKPSGKPKEWSTDAVVAFADVRAQLALAQDKVPAQRERLADEARLGYQKALQRDPKSKGALLGLARLYAGIDERQRADEQYRQYLALNPKDHAIVFEVARTHARWKDMPGATAWCQQALVLDPENREYRKTLGFFLVHGGEWEKGFALLCQILPEAQARFFMAKALDQHDRPEASRQQLTLALQADPAFAPARELLAELQADPAAPPQVPAEAGPVQAVGYRLPAPGP